MNTMVLRINPIFATLSLSSTCTFLFLSHLEVVITIVRSQWVCDWTHSC